MSRNVLPSVDTSDNNVCSNGDNGVKYQDSPLTASHGTYKLFGNKTLLKRGRQGEFKNVKSIIEDFRQSNPDILARVGNV